MEREEISVYPFPLSHSISSFSLHFLILSPFLCSLAARLPRVVTAWLRTKQKQEHQEPGAGGMMYNRSYYYLILQTCTHWPKSLEEAQGDAEKSCIAYILFICMVGDDVEGLRPELCMNCSSANNASILHDNLNLYDMAVYG